MFGDNQKACLFYSTPCMSFFNSLFINMTTTPAIAGIIANKIKNVLKLYSSENLPTNPPNDPAALLPMAIAKYHIPNIKAIILPGTNFDT